MKNINKTRTAIRQLLNQIEVPTFEHLKKGKKDTFAENREKKRAKYLKWAKTALNPVSQQMFYKNIKNGEKLSVAIENKQDKYKFMKSSEKIT
jgi:hypothetical protein